MPRREPAETWPNDPKLKPVLATPGYGAAVLPDSRRAHHRPAGQSVELRL